MTVSRPPNATQIPVREEPQVEYLQLKRRPDRKVRLVVPKWLILSMVIVPIFGALAISFGFFVLPRAEDIKDSIVAAKLAFTRLEWLSNNTPTREDIMSAAREGAREAAREEIGDVKLAYAKRLDQIRSERDAAKAEAKRKAEEAARLKSALEAGNEEKRKLAEAVDILQQKLEGASSQTDVDEILKHAAAHLPREDVEALMLMEKINVRESSGRIRALGPWVKVYVRDQSGKRRVKRRSDGFNPWNKVERGIVYDRAYGASQMMGDNIPEWSEEATGIRYTPNELMNNSVDYRRTVIHRLKKLLATYKNPRDVISVWHSGQSLNRAKKNGSRDVNMATADYTESVVTADPLRNRGYLRNAREGEEPLKN